MEIRIERAMIPVQPLLSQWAMHPYRQVVWEYSSHNGTVKWYPERPVAADFAPGLLTAYIDNIVVELNVLDAALAMLDPPWTCADIIKAIKWNTEAEVKGKEPEP